MTRRCLPLVSLPNDTVPVTSASMPASFGERASNSSATRGRPPVMSRVFERLLRDPREHLADGHLLAVLDRDDRAELERDVHRVVGAGELDLVAALVEQLHLRTHALRRARRAALRIDDDQRRQAGHVVDLLGDRHALLDVLELHGAGVLGDDRTRGRVPQRQHLAGLDDVAVLAPAASRRTAPCGARARGRCRRGSSPRPSARSRSARPSRW